MASLAPVLALEGSVSFMWLRAHLMYMPVSSRFFIFNKTLDHRCEGPVEAPCFSIAIWMPLTGAGVFNLE